LVEDGEVGGEAGGGAELAEEAVGRAMKGAPLDLMGGGTDQALAAVQHLLGGAAGEGEEEEAAGGESALDEGGDAVDEGAGFPRPGTGDYKEGPVGVGGGVGLGGIEGRSVPGRGR
jgi:hypothetical protein